MWEGLLLFRDKPKIIPNAMRYLWEITQISQHPVVQNLFVFQLQQCVWGPSATFIMDWTIENINIHSPIVEGVGNALEGQDKESLPRSWSDKRGLKLS